MLARDRIHTIVEVISMPYEACAHLASSLFEKGIFLRGAAFDKADSPSCADSGSEASLSSVDGVVSFERMHGTHSRKNTLNIISRIAKQTTKMYSVRKA